ncbi:TolC family protein [Polaribacter sp. ALD11]|uniref:TolC family protein n=1 Tax=Polaribacter sp. ALD11 TaxID=2058137 RepID=UPI000C308D83|nr:TolC family protein [Polaribacter sp. ALD11]AUC86517.1 TolC family protein [Polaribacter sp. ALD11]
MQLKQLNSFLLAFACFISSISIAQQLDSNLKNLIEKGLQKSHKINIQNLESGQSKIDQKLAKSVFLPKVTFNGSYTRLDDNISFDGDTQNLLISTQKLLIKEAAGIPFNSPFPSNIQLEPVPYLQNKNILKSSMDVDWILFSGFEASNAIKASKFKEASLNYLVMAEKDKIALKIIETYDKLALVYASERVLNTSRNFLNEQKYYVKKAIENGLATPISRKKIELAEQQLAGKFLEFKHNKTLLIEVLHQLTGESRSNLNSFNPQLEVSTNDSSSSIKKRNEVKALEEAEKATLYKSKMEKSNFIPKLALKGHYEFIEDDLSLLDPKWYIGVGIRWNVFDGNQSRLKSEKSLMESQKYREQIEEANELIGLSIIKAELTNELSLQNTEIVQKEIELASDTYDMINKQYKNGLTSINDVLDALNDLEKANFKLQESFFNQRRAVTNLLYAKGILNYE